MWGFSFLFSENFHRKIGEKRKSFRYARNVAIVDRILQAKSAYYASPGHITVGARPSRWRPFSVQVSFLWRGNLQRFSEKVAGGKHLKWGTPSSGMGILLPSMEHHSVVSQIYRDCDGYNVIALSLPCCDTLS